MLFKGTKELEVELVYAEFMEDNIGSGRVMEKCGMKKDGILRNRCVDKTGKRENLLAYSITKDEFLNISS